MNKKVSNEVVALSEENQAANSPYVRNMKYNDIVNVVVGILSAKGLAFWALEVLPVGPKAEVLRLLNSSCAIFSAGSVETIYTDFSLNAAEAIEEEQDAMDL